MEYIDEITKKVAGEIADFEKKHGYINGGFATGLARKYVIEAYQEGLKDFEESNKRADELMDKLRFKEQYNEAYNQGVRDAAEVVKCGKCEMLGVLSPCDECHYHGNKKQSILKLLK